MTAVHREALCYSLRKVLFVELLAFVNEVGFSCRQWQSYGLEPFVGLFLWLMVMTVLGFHFIGIITAPAKQRGQLE